MDLVILFIALTWLTVTIFYVLKILQRWLSSVIKCYAARTQAILGGQIANLERTNAQLRQAIQPFDRDGDGKPGGSRSKISK